MKHAISVMIFIFKSGARKGNDTIRISFKKIQKGLLTYNFPHLKQRALSPFFKFCSSLSGSFIKHFGHFPGIFLFSFLDVPNEDFNPHPARWATLSRKR